MQVKCTIGPIHTVTSMHKLATVDARRFSAVPWGDMRHPLNFYFERLHKRTSFGKPRLHHGSFTRYCLAGSEIQYRCIVLL